MSGWKTKFIDKIERAESTKSFRFEKPEDFEYISGQYFFIMIPGVDGRMLMHHFSFSSSPTENHIEFTTRIRDSEYKQALEKLPIGVEVDITEVQGDFVVSPRMKKVAFFCGGIGITPAMSTAKWVFDTHADVDIILLYANRNQAGTAFKDELEKLSGRKLKVTHILSKPEEDWKGATGYINMEFVKESVPDWKERTFFVSGPPPMVEAIKKVLTDDLGVIETKIKAENFLGY